MGVILEYTKFTIELIVPSCPGDGDYDGIEDTIVDLLGDNLNWPFTMNIEKENYVN